MIALVRHYIVFPLLTVMAFNLSSQENAGIPGVTSGGDANIIISRDQVYDGGQLWGYIDGGADLYLEYGFISVRVQEIATEQKTYKVDIYKMTDAPAAFGIFSVYRRKCMTGFNYPYPVCVTRYQTLATRGSYYISIINASGTGEEINKSLTMVESLAALITEEPFEPPGLFLSEELQPYLQNLKLLKGELGIINVAPSYADLFNNMDGYLLFYLPVTYDNSSIIVSDIIFSSSGQLNTFLKNLTGNDITFVHNDKILEISTTSKIKLVGSSELLMIDIKQGNFNDIPGLITSLGFQ